MKRYRGGSWVIHYEEHTLTIVGGSGGHNNPQEKKQSRGSSPKKFKFGAFKAIYTKLLILNV